MTEQQALVAYQGAGLLSDLPSFSLTNCYQASMAGQFIMVTFGPEIVEFDDAVRGVNFNRDFGRKKCELKDTPFRRGGSYRERLEKFEADWNLISSCLMIEVEDVGSQRLNFPTKQNGCTIINETPNRAYFNGGYCFFKPNFGSSFMIKIKVQKDCLRVNHLESLGIRTQDLFSAINIYLAGDATGRSSQLKALSNVSVRLSINPLKDLISSSDDFGILYPTWPETWAIPDVHFAPLKLNIPGNGNIQIESPLLVNNNCQGKCREKFCQSPCDYAQPIAGEFTLFEIVEGKEQIMTTWLNGGIVPPNFQGTITGQMFEVPENYFIQGKEYIIEAVFNEPKYDFDRFKNQIKKRLNTIEQQIGRITNSNIPGIQEIPSINDGRNLPQISTIPNLIFDQSLNGVESAVENLRSYLNLRIWPPFYNGICHGSKCIQNRERLLVLRAKIKILPPSEEDSELPYEIVKIERNSAFVPSYIKPDFHRFRISCHDDSQEKL